MTHTINSTRTAAVSTETEWLTVDCDTPRGVKLMLISKPSGVAQIGTLLKRDTYWTHWHPLPKWSKS
jgi:hypothetical protein